MKLALNFSVLALVAGFAGPVFADEMADMSKMTCKDYMAMDMDGMMKAGMMMKEAMKDDAAAMAMTDEEEMKAVSAACEAHPDAMVMDAMKM